MFPNLRAIRNMLGVGKDDETPIPIRGPVDMTTQQVNKQGTICERDDPYRSIGGICITNLHFQAFYQGVMQQEIKGREWWIRIGPFHFAPGGNYIDTKTGQRYWQPSGRMYTTIPPRPPAPASEEGEDEK